MKSLEELKAIREKNQSKVGVRSESDTQTRVVVGMATCGIAAAHGRCWPPLPKRFPNGTCKT